MKKHTIANYIRLTVNYFSITALVFLTPSTITAQKLSKEYLARMDKMKIEELKIENYVDNKMAIPFPKEILEGYINTFKNHGHDHGEIRESDLPLIKLNFIRNYYRQQYFKEYHESKKIYNQNTIPSNSPSDKLLGGGCLDFEQDPFDLFEGFSASGSVNGYTGGHCNAIPNNGVGGFGWTPTALNVPSDNFSLVSNGSDPLVPALDMTNNNSGFAARINAATPCTPNQGINRLTSTFTANNNCNQTITFSYALVMEFANNHVANQDLSFFVARILDANTSLELDRICVVPDMTFNSETPSNCNGSFTDALLWQDWQVGTLNYNSVAGVSYTVEFIVADCAQSGHFGYAYIDDVCFNQDPPIIVNLGPDQLTCNGSSVNLNAGSGFTNYQWSQPGTCLYGGPSMNACVTGNYCVTVTNASGCTASDCAYITISNMPNITILCTDPDICLGESVTLSANPSCIGCTYSWSPGGYTTSSITVSPLSTTNYSLVVTNAQGCVDFASQQVTVDQACAPTSLCMHIDQTGNLDVGRGVKATTDGGFIAVGDISGSHSSSDRDMYVIKYKPDMTVDFRKRIGDAQSGPSTYIYNESGFDVMPVSDGYLVAGTVSLTSTNSNIILLKLDLNGNFDWRTTRTTVSTDKIEEARKIVKISPPSGAPDRYYLVGHTNGGTSTTDYDILIYEFDPTDGSIIGTPERFGDTGISEFATDAIANDDANAIIVSGFADMSPTNRDMYALKVSSNLSLISAFYNGGAGRDVFNSIAQVGKDLFFAGATRSWAHTTSDNIYLMRVDESTFISNANKIYYSTIDETANSIIKTSDNNLHLVGTYRGDGINMKVDASLNQIWLYKSTLTRSDALNCVTEQDDGLFVAVGMYNEGTSDDEFYISRIKPSGSSCCNNTWTFSPGNGKNTNPKGGQRSVSLTNVKWGLIDNAGVEKYLCQDYTMLREGNFAEETPGEETTFDTKFKVMPNPGNGIFNVVFESASEPLNLNVYDLSGRKIKSVKGISNLTYTLDLTRITKGIYLLEVSGANFNERQKVVLK